MAIVIVHENDGTVEDLRLKVKIAGMSGLRVDS